MTSDDRFDGRLRARFTAPPPGASARNDCPEADRLAAAATGGLPFVEIERLLEHAASCAACTVAWRMARERALAEGEAVRGRVPLGLRLAAAAAVVGLAVATTLLLRGGPVGPPSMRATAPAVLRSAIADGAALPRDAFVLRWTEGPAGTRYRVLVTDERLDPIADRAGLETAELRVDANALAALPDGARVLWQVKADLPGGTRVASETFVARIAGDPPR